MEVAVVAGFEAREVAVDGVVLAGGYVGGYYGFDFVRFVGREVLVEEVGFGLVEAVELPFGGCDAVDGLAFLFGVRLEGVVELLAEFCVVVGGFGFEEDAGGVEAVGAVVAGGAAFSFWGFGASGEGSVGSGGSNSGE